MQGRNTPTHPQVPPDAPVTLDGFDVLDTCHRQTVFTLGKLAALVARLRSLGPDDEARALAAQIVDHFTTTARQHHADEEQHVFPKLLAAGDPKLVQAVLSLQQDHFWLEVDWTELSPQLEAVAAGRTCPDLDALHEAVEIFATLSRAHIALEEAWIYPEARSRLQDRERHEMAREMANRRRSQRTHPAGAD